MLLSSDLLVVLQVIWVHAYRYTVIFHDVHLFHHAKRGIPHTPD